MNQKKGMLAKPMLRAVIKKALTKTEIRQAEKGKKLGTHRIATQRTPSLWHILRFHSFNSPDDSRSLTLVFLHVLSNEIFSAITTTIGTIFSVFISQRR